MVKRLITLLCLLAGPTISLHSQATPTASRAGDLQIGAGFVSADSDYGSRRFKGIAGYADFDFTRHFGAEFTIHQIYTPYGDQVHERSYELGGRYYRTYGRYKPYVKILYGRGVFNFTNNVANLAYNLAAGGGGVDVRILRHVNARADFEYQRWFSFQGSSLSPSLITIGGAYHF